MNTYTKNNETGKLELRFNKSDYLSLPYEKKKEIKSTFLWSSYAGAWVSRSIHNHWRAEQIAKELGLTYEGETGEKLSYAEQVERSQERAADRAERFAARAVKAERESESRYKAANQIGSMIPFGQPILVGHHSEKRHRRDLDKIDNNMRKSCEASDKAAYYAGRALAAEYNASDAKFKNVEYLLNRIEEAKAEIRAIDRRLALDPSEGYRATLETSKAEYTDKLDFFKTKLEEAGGGQMTRERLKEMKPLYVKVRRYGKTWWPLKSINRDTVTVLNWLDIARFTWKFRLDEIIETSETAVVVDRDGNEVKPTIKYK